MDGKKNDPKTGQFDGFVKISPWLELCYVFQTFEDDVDCDVAEIRKLLEEDEVSDYLSSKGERYPRIPSIRFSKSANFSRSAEKLLRSFAINFVWADPNSWAISYLASETTLFLS